jgi:hypothetical protein
VSDVSGESRKGLSRRDLIKASAVAGGAAWAAPVILDSLSSPAAAMSSPLTGCNVASFNSNCATDSHSPCTIPNTCTLNNLIATCLTITCSGSGSSRTATVVNNCGSCTITFAQAAHGNTCTNGTINGNTVTWPLDNYGQYEVALTC